MAANKTKRATSKRPAKSRPEKKVKSVEGELIPATNEASPTTDWPPNLTEDKAEELFKALETPMPRTEAAPYVGLSYRTVFRWLKKHKRFAELFEESESIGFRSVVDTFPTIAKTARCKESAAAARAQVEILDKYLQRAAPHQFNVRMLQHSLSAGGDGGSTNGAVVGVVILPMKDSGRGLPPSNEVPGLGAVIVPPKASSEQDPESTA